MNTLNLYNDLAHACEYGVHLVRSYYRDQCRDSYHKTKGKHLVEQRDKIKGLLLELEEQMTQQSAELRDLQDLLEYPQENATLIDEFYLSQYLIVREFAVLLKTTEHFGDFGKLRAVELVFKQGCK